MSFCVDDTQNLGWWGGGGGGRHGFFCGFVVFGFFNIYRYNRYNLLKSVNVSSLSVNHCGLYLTAVLQEIIHYSFTLLY